MRLGPDATKAGTVKRITGVGCTWWLPISTKSLRLCTRLRDALVIPFRSKVARAIRNRKPLDSLVMSLQLVLRSIAGTPRALWYDACSSLRTKEALICPEVCTYQYRLWLIYMPENASCGCEPGETLTMMLLTSGRLRGPIALGSSVRVEPHLAVSLMSDLDLSLACFLSGRLATAIYPK